MPLIVIALILEAAAIWIWRKGRQQKNVVVYENYDGKTQTMMAKICCPVLGLQRQKLIGLLAKLACVLLLRSKKDVWEGNMLFIPFFKIKCMT